MYDVKRCRRLSCRHCKYSSSDPGRPLDDTDFFLISPIQNSDTDRKMSSLMKKISTKKEISLEKLEANGEQTIKKLNKRTQSEVAFRRCMRSLFSKDNSTLIFSHRWPNGIVPYTIDAAFSESERAIIASAFTHVQNNSCVRFDFHAYG